MGRSLFIRETLLRKKFYVSCGLGLDTSISTFLIGECCQMLPNPSTAEVLGRKKVASSESCFYPTTELYDVITPGFILLVGRLRLTQ